ncbi:TonB-dependent receptor [Fulvivirgaceae bacterium PWU5]|uniref:TonB-dependent receptor n=2 Tax=Dawidia cretensis TaxID=2782350 RepID=A0AAP2E144_9BACT|nr:TonB-dependent receptor [Dawidia cretensis]
MDLSGNPVPGTSLFVSGTAGTGTMSDENGKFLIKGVKTGKIKLHVTAVGFAAQTHELKIEKEKTLSFNVTLTSAETELSEVVVEGKSENQVRMEEIRTSGFHTSVIDLKTYNNMTTDVNQVLKRTAGLVIRESGGMGSDFTFRINGLAGKIYIDDVPMDQYGSSMTLNNIPVNLVDRIEVYKGVVPAHLGSDAMGGAVNIITKQRTRKFLDISQSYGSFNTHQTAITGGIRDKKTGLKARASAYYNFSDNNYRMYSDPEYDVVLNVVRKDPDAASDVYRYVPIDKARRFHDRYWSVMGEMEIGFEKVKWADWFTVGLTYSENMKQVQTGATINAVRGGAWTENRYIMPTVKYRKENFLIKGLYANLYANYSRSTDNIRDTARYNYDWGGTWVANASGKPLDEIHNRLIDDSFVGRANFNYDLDQELNHSLNLNYTFSTTKRHTYDLMRANPDQIETSGLPKRLGKHIVGLSWQGQWFNKKLISVLSVKYYGMDTRVAIDNREFDETGKPIGGEINTTANLFNYPSGSLALRYRLTPELGIKASVERGYNLPETTSLFGDGRFVLANYDLTPERSDNFNAGFYYNHFFGDHFINIDAAGFYRNSENYILAQVLPDNIYSQSRNFPGVLLYGAEAEVKYGYKDIVSLSLNGTYDKAIDSWKYTDSTNSKLSLTYHEQLPNRPWAYGNANLSLGKKDLIGKDTRLQLSYLYQNIHWFYMTWAKLGHPSSLNYVPAQTIHTVILTYSWKKDIYNISFEARNLTDERAYDSFRLQKPGRAFYVKFRVSIM